MGGKGQMWSFLKNLEVNAQMQSCNLYFIKICIVEMKNTMMIIVVMTAGELKL
jgi:hypothetical protein